MILCTELCVYIYIKELWDEFLKWFPHNAQLLGRFQLGVRPGWHK